ncbi:hypothetical protein D3C77_734050 [compost metagenome]
MRQARDRVINDNHAVTFELAAFAVELTVANLEEVQKRDQRFLTLAERLEHPLLPIGALKPVPRQVTLLTNHFESFEPEHHE